MSLLLVGDPEDLTQVYVGWLARRRGLPVVQLPESDVGEAWTFTFDDQRPWEGWVEAHGSRHDFINLLGAFVRLNPDPSVPGGLDLSPVERTAFVSERRGGIQQLLNDLPCGVVNRPGAGRSNGSKPFQMRMLARAGLEVPRWIVSNSPEAVARFASDAPAGAIYKAVSGLRSTVRHVGDELLERLRAGTAPVVVQEYVPGREVRVHIVGDHIFPTEVMSPDVDYRFGSGPKEFRPASVPHAIAVRCCAIAAGEGLALAGFDFRITAQGRWLCLEMNPVPTFLPYEMATGQPIGDAVLDHLERASAEAYRASVG